MAAPNSPQTIPSGMAMSSATSQPSIACGPPNAVISNGIVMNGPMPIMFDMFRAVACSKPKRRSRWGWPFGGAAGFIGALLTQHGDDAIQRISRQLKPDVWLARLHPTLHTGATDAEDR